MYVRVYGSSFYGGGRLQLNLENEVEILNVLNSSSVEEGGLLSTSSSA